MRRNKNARSGPLALMKTKFLGKHRCRSKGRGGEPPAPAQPVGADRPFAGARRLRKSIAATSSTTNSAGFPKEQHEPCGLVISPVVKFLNGSGDSLRTCLSPVRTGLKRLPVTDSRPSPLEVTPNVRSLAERPAKCIEFVKGVSNKTLGNPGSANESVDRPKREQDQKGRLRSLVSDC